MRVYTPDLALGQQYISIEHDLPDQSKDNSQERTYDEIKKEIGDGDPKDYLKKQL